MSAVPWIKVYRLTSIDAGDGIACDERGIFVGGVPLLKRESEGSGNTVWVVRPIDEINLVLSRRYGVPVDFTSRLRGLHGIAKALNRGEFSIAVIATLHLRLPDPQPRESLSCCVGETLKVVEDLRNVALLKADWNPARHPRWPAGDPDSRGGQFAPADSTTISPAPTDASGLIPAQATIPWLGPWDFPMDIPWRMPAPGDILPPRSIFPINKSGNGHLSSIRFHASVNVLRNGTRLWNFVNNKKKRVNSNPVMAGLARISIVVFVDECLKNAAAIAPMPDILQFRG